jgi:hypothetical protein
MKDGTKQINSIRIYYREGGSGEPVTVQIFFGNDVIATVPVEIVQ